MSNLKVSRKINFGKFTFPGGGGLLLVIFANLYIVYMYNV